MPYGEVLDKCSLVGLAALPNRGFSALLFSVEVQRVELPFFPFPSSAREHSVVARGCRRAGRLYRATGFQMHKNPPLRLTKTRGEFVSLLDR